MLLNEFFGKPVDIGKKMSKDQDDQKLSDELFWYIVDHDRLHKDFFHPLAAKMKIQQDGGKVDKEKTVSEFAPMVKKGCLEFFKFKKMKGHPEKVFHKELFKDICEKLYDHYNQGIQKDHYTLGLSESALTSPMSMQDYVRMADNIHAKMMAANQRNDADEWNRLKQEYEQLAAIAKKGMVPESQVDEIFNPSSSLANLLRGIGEVAGDLMPVSTNQTGNNNMAEELVRGVDAKGRTQSQWMKLVKAKFPNAKMQQAKMPDGPCQAILPDGRKLFWNKVKQGVAEGWKDEANDYKEWSNYVKDELSSVAPSQQYSMAQRLSQIERKHFGSEIETGFNTQTGKPDSTSNKGLTGTVSQIYSAIKDGSLGAAAPATGTQSTQFGTVTKPTNAPDLYRASPAAVNGNRPAAQSQSPSGSGNIKILRTEEDWEEALNNQDSSSNGPMTASGFSSAMSKLPSWKVMLATIMLASKLPIIGDKVKNTIVSSIKNEFGVQMSFKEALGYMQHVRTTPPEEIVSPAVWKFEKDGGDYETAIEQLPDDDVNVSPAHVMATISNNLISSGVAQEIKPKKEEKPTSGGAGAFGNMASQLTNKNEPVAEGIGGAVDAKGRTQDQWAQLVMSKFPGTKITQAKMIDGPMQATLPDGRKLYWSKVDQGVAADKQVPIGEHLENQMSKFIGRIIANEAIQNNQRRSKS